MSKVGGALSKFFGRTSAGLPKPETGVDTFPQASARRVSDQMSKGDLEKMVNEGAEVESLVRMPGWLRYQQWMSRERDRCAKALATEDFGKENDRLKAVQLKFATLEECIRWAEVEIAAGKNAADQLTGGM